ncbi:MAG: copper homeostasis protein CutC [Paramuribaculum sp.]|nr:copper homeostasis protein CutC [Paramuribaculum sp.]
MNRILEICCADIESVIAANRGGTDRIELCTALQLDGLTPSAGMIEQALAIGGMPVRVLIRPRPGDFVYSQAEVDVMLRDIRMCNRLGVEGVVIGVLTPDGAVDTDTCRRLIDAAGKMSVTFHRAFDVCTDPLEALVQIIDLGCDTLLTSGQQPRALDGISLLRTLVERSEGRIDIMAGAGVNPSNAAEILQATGCPCIHGSARSGTHTDPDIVSQLHHIVHP